jgi:RHS repeat-associated protein
VYRYAYQGQELDKETGMEAFQLRLWDGRIGRWLSPDPYGQHFSPYLGMGNSPVNTIDPDGGWETKFGAWWHGLWDGRDGTVFQSETMGDWGIAYQGEGFDPGDGGVGVNGTYTFGGERYNTFDKWDREIIAGGIDNYSHLRTENEWSRYSMDDKLTVARKAIFRDAMNEAAIEPFSNNMKALYSTGLYGSGLGTGPNVIGSYVASTSKFKNFADVFKLATTIEKVKAGRKGIIVGESAGKVYNELIKSGFRVHSKTANIKRLVRGSEEIIFRKSNSGGYGAFDTFTSGKTSILFK